MTGDICGWEGVLLASSGYKTRDAAKHQTLHITTPCNKELSELSRAKCH